jgi:MtN3 and saliva related transmembrane protein
MSRNLEIMHRAGAANNLFSAACMRRLARLALAILFITASLYALEDAGPRDPWSLLAPTLRRSEIFGFVAGLGTTFAALPDLLAMFRRRSSAGMNPRMATITGTFQILWIYYGWLIVSRPVMLWNLMGVLINFLSFAAYRHFRRLEKTRSNPTVEV